ncbi:MAG: outer membrane beta-barrel protein [Bacteroidetes bacterium]|nr:outer membrane beta-barrel protein [Bacteroidota bacterium]
MKRILVALLFTCFGVAAYSQAAISPAERQALIEQIKKEILDSIRNEGIEVAKDATDSVRIAKANQWKGHVEFSGYMEAYYLYDFNQPSNHTRPGFIYSHNRHNEINVNLAYLKMAYVAPRLRANIAVMMGTYSNANLAAEPGLLKNIYEANAGINLSKKKQVWLDGGVFASHLGFESAVGKDCWNLTRSMLADNSPYYESGLKLTYTSDNGKLLVSGLVLNGWQRIQRVDGNSLPSFGWQVQGKPNDKVLINSSAFIGSDKPDSVRQMRYFHNFYTVINATSKFGLILGFDAGMEQKAKGSKQYNYWYSPILIARYTPIEQLALAARFEYYEDKNGVIIGTGTPNGFGTLGYSLNLDYSPISNAMIRLEGRLLHSYKDEIFQKKDGSYTQFSPSLGVSFAYAFSFAPRVK